MKQMIRQHWLALSVVVVAAVVVAACGQVTTGEEAQSASDLRAARPKTAQLVQADVCVDGDPACIPTGAHGKHGGFDCKVCHAVGGRLSFSKTTIPTAYRPGSPAPTFDASAKTCSNVACHAVPAGVYTYEVYNWGSDTYDVVNAPYGGPGQGPTPSWYETANSGGCTSCHNLTYTSGTNSVKYPWHTGVHGYYMVGQTVPNTVDAYNQCQSCHPNATGFIQENGTVVGAAITNASLHVNGVVNVQKKMNAGDCFGCH